MPNNKKPGLPPPLDESEIYESKKDIIDFIADSSHRRIVPFIGSGVSVSSGFPTIGPVTEYLAKVAVAIRFGIYQDRFPDKDGDTKLVGHYSRHPSEFIKIFGWPNIGNLDADLWAWLHNEGKKKYPGISKIKDTNQLLNDLTGKPNLENRYHLLALVQWLLRREQAQRDEGTALGIEKEWHRWKEWQSGTSNINPEEDPPKLLNGDWELLLDTLCEGDYGLADRLFNEFEKGLCPSRAHRLLAFLQPKLNIPLILTTNFDSLLERAFREEGLTPKVFDVHRNADLPDSSLIDDRQFTVLKLHGSAYGLRFGERLKQKLETDARTNVLNYLPRNALILVLGFSGSERRMMQILQSIAENGNEGEDQENTRIIWVQGPGGGPRPLFDELVNKDKKKTDANSPRVRACKVKHADTFLQELYFKIASTHQATIKNTYAVNDYLYMTELDLEIEKISGKPHQNSDKSPIQVFIADQNDNKRSGNWATLAGTAFTQSLHQSYKIIWIDLEDHCTLESVIAEFFNRVKTISPKSPGFNFSSLASEESFGQNSNDIQISKAVDRVIDVFHRGKYVLVLDSVESFCRPPMAHHGISAFPLDKDNQDSLLKQFKRQVGFLKTFLIALFNKSCDDFKDSYLVVTIDKPRQRHKNQDKDGQDHAFDTFKKTIEELIEEANKKGNVDEELIPLINYHRQGGQTYVNFHEGLNADPKEKLDPNWQPKLQQDGENNRSLNRARHVYFLLKLLRIKHCEISQEDIKGAISAFVGLLAFFRRSRGVPLLHAMTERWVLRKILGVKPDVEQSEQTHYVIAHLLDLITPNGPKTEFSSKLQDNHVGEQLLAIGKPDNAVGIVAQRYEGGNIWMFREAHEATYEAISETLHRQEWVNAWKNNTNTPKNVSYIAAILDGMIGISWHLHAARSYYVDVYMPTRDIHAFYEYLYHRVSALRTMALLMAILEKAKEGKWQIEEDIYNELNNLMTVTSLTSNLKFQHKNAIKWFAEVIGVFAEDPEYKSDDSTNETDATDYLLARLESLRTNSLKTLFKALERNKVEFRTQSIPEVVLSWSRQFTQREMAEIRLDSLNVSPDPDSETIIKLDEYFKEIEFNAYLSKLDFGIHQADKSIEGIEKLRCLMHINPEQAKNDVKVLLQSCDKEKQKREVESLHATIILAKWLVCEPLRDRELPSQDSEALISDAETSAIACEGNLRLTSSSREEEAKLRSNAFILRARSLYLRGHFQQAHRFLDLASSGLFQDNPDHRAYAVIIHILRAELLATSADQHYRQLVRKPYEVDASINKIGRAEYELRLAEGLFQNMAHRNIWLVFLEFERAQLRLERMLFEMEALFLEQPPLSSSEYLKRSGILEHHVLEGLGRLRNVLELIPFRAENWDETFKAIQEANEEFQSYLNKNKPKSSGTPMEEDYPTLIKIERMSYALWDEFYIVGLNTDLLLRHLYQNQGRPNERSDNTQNSAGSHFDTRWRGWNKSMRFINMSKVSSLPIATDTVFWDETGQLKPDIPYRSLWENVIDIMIKANQPRRIDDIWNIRRKVEV